VRPVALSWRILEEVTWPKGAVSAESSSGVKGTGRLPIHTLVPATPGHEGGEGVAPEGIASVGVVRGGGESGLVMG